MPVKRTVLFYFIFALLNMALAGPSGDFYVIEVPVMSQSLADREQATALGLQQMLIKLSADPTIIEADEVQQALPEANHYLSQFRYIAALNGENMSHHVLRMQFIPQRIHQLVQESGRSAWLSLRPSVLLWLLINHEGQWGMLAEGDDSGVGLQIGEIAQQRGIPIILPLGDLSELALVQPLLGKDINIPSFADAASRYNTDVVLMAVVSKSPAGRWFADWHLLQKDTQYCWQLQHDQLSDLIVGGIDRMGALLMQNERPSLLQRVSDDASVILTVESIQSMEDYLHLNDFLQQLAVVDELTAVRLSPHRVVYELQLSSDVAAFAEALADYPQLLPSYEDGQKVGQLVYQLLS